MSAPLVNTHEELNVPGGVGFVDATGVLERGTEEMTLGTMLTVEGFELNDAMSALEIMDPRMDSGMVEPPPAFKPNAPLLPSETYSLTVEMSWHAGLALSQTIYTLQYVHHLGDITNPLFVVDPATLSTDASNEPEDSERPVKLVTLVLRASMFALLKCSDLVWREIAHDHLIDGEDWNSEKYGVSLCEGVQPEAVLSLLDEAVTWLQRSSSLKKSPWRDPLTQRLLMRRNVLQTLLSPTISSLESAQENLDAILAGPFPSEPSTAVHNIFDPTITSRLVSLVPTRLVRLPPQHRVWEAVAMLFDQWKEIKQLEGAENLSSVKMLASLRAYEDHSPRRSPFLRSLSISTFFNGSKILLVHDPPWIIDRFLLETAAIRQGLLCELEEQVAGNDNDTMPIASSGNREFRTQLLDDGPTNPSPEPTISYVELFEKGLAKLLVEYITSFYHNRARQRRKLVASLIDWHLALEHASTVVTRLSAASSPTLALSRVPLCVRHNRLLIIAEVVFSGFELELYARHEWPMIYWYIGQVLSTQIAVLGELEASLLRESDNVNVFRALAYIAVQKDYADALRCFANAMRDTLIRYAPSRVEIDAAREQANFKRRFKWAFYTGYSEAKSIDEDRPILGMWRRWLQEQELDSNGTEQIVQNLVHARDGFLHLSRRRPADTSAIFCKEEYKEFMVNLARACDRNLLFFQRVPEVLDENLFEWKWESSRWFPQITKARNSPSLQPGPHPSSGVL